MVADPDEERPGCTEGDLFIARKTADMETIRERQSGNPGRERQTDCGTGRKDDSKDTKTGSEEKQKTNKSISLK